MKSILEDAAERLDETTKKNLGRVVDNRMKKEYDYVMIVVGKVGDGKSMLASLACSLVDRTFNPDRVFFTGMDYRMAERRLKERHALQFDEGEEVFFSRGAMGRQQKQMILKFAQIRQRNHFIVICVPSLFLLEKWMRGIGETRVNCIWRVVRRGMFYCYADKNGTIGKIRIDPSKNKIWWPPADFIGFWKEIPKTSTFWKEYLRRKHQFLSSARESVKVSREREKIQRKMGESLTAADISEIQQVGISTVKKWLSEGAFPKRSVFMGLDGRLRVKFKGYQIGVKKLERLKERQRRIASMKMLKGVNRFNTRRRNKR